MWVKKTTTYFLFSRLSDFPHLVHGVFTRLGGTSYPPYAGLNTSYAVGDLPANVTANITMIKNDIGAEQLVFMNQPHADGITIILAEDMPVGDHPPNTDALITNVPGIALMVKQADCQGVIVFDPKNGIVANIHCGWRGNVKDILGRVVNTMKQTFGSRGTDLLAAIGPSLGPCCAEFVGHKNIFPRDFEEFMVRENYFNLWAVSGRQLVRAGLREENIEVTGICTRCKTDLFYSYRAEGETGRFGTVAMLK